MSAPASTAPSSRRAVRRPIAGRSGARSAAPAQPQRAESTRSIASLPFVLGIAGLLAGGLVALLMINNSLAAGSFERARVRADATLLAEQEQALNQEVERLSSPTRLRQAAKDLGLIPAAATAYVDLADGRILGTPMPAGGPYFVLPKEDDQGAFNPDGSDGAVRILRSRGTRARPLSGPVREEPAAPGEGDGASVEPEQSAYDRAIVSGERR